ncbi:MAG: hypothetical protein AAFV59_07960 [Pseudomonadota bacterium]
MPKIFNRFVCTSFSVFALAACDGSGSNYVAANKTATASARSPEAMLVLSCSGCHSARNGAIASLAPYTEDMLRATLIRYKSESDGTTVMHRLARGYSDEEIDLIAEHLGRQEEVQ